MEESDNVLEYFCGKRIGIQKETFIGMIPFSLFLQEEDQFPDVFEDDMYRYVSLENFCYFLRNFCEIFDTVIKNHQNRLVIQKSYLDSRRSRKTFSNQ